MESNTGVRVQEKEGNPSITVAGVTFTAEQVLTASVLKDGREIIICRKEKPESQIGFLPNSDHGSDKQTTETYTAPG